MREEKEEEEEEEEEKEEEEKANAEDDRVLARKLLRDALIQPRCDRETDVWSTCSGPSMGPRGGAGPSRFRGPQA
ncbi:hypothetical protein ALC56_03363 [Trachymyrmex septentrionalis]|uniref:Uncharacterized protein n=1 Tax=Trachymyrmex septentrionalis TaxID=34720 RepID=A0A195FNU6_9HYME|nr:hypothetical protein ALC56_03363 [Trachymyrmex septentrionalis]